MRRSLSAALALALCLSLASCSKPASPPEEGAGGIAEKTSGESVAVEVNSPAPAFAAKLMGGGELRLSDYAGKVVLLEFWSIFCKSCLQEMPSVRELHAKYKAEGFEVVSVNTDAFSDARVMQTLQKAGLNFDYPVVRDTRREVSEAYNVQILPVTVIIDRSGWIRLCQEGYAPGEETKFEKVITRYLRDSGREDVTFAPRGGVTRFAPKGSNSGVDVAPLKPTERKTVEGETIRVGGRPTALFFWSLYCQPCREEFPTIGRLREEWAAKGADVIAVNVDSPKLNDRVVKFVSAYPGLKCVNDEFMAEEPNLSSQFGIEETPTVVVLDGKGAVVETARGGADVPKIAAALAKAGAR